MKQIFAMCTCLAAAVAIVSAAVTAEAESKEERFIGAIVTSTTTLSRLRTTTVTQPITCVQNVLPEVACVGRRRRRSIDNESTNFKLLTRGTEQAALPLASSMSGADGDNARDGKLLLFATRYVTSFTDFTTTSTSTDSATTVQVTLYCTLAGATEPARLCVPPE